jgi:hypothetical protein
MTLTDVQRATLFNMAAGQHSLIRSGPHLAKLAREGLIERTNSGQYGLTNAGKAALAESEVSTKQNAPGVVS